MKEWKECDMCHRIFKATNGRSLYCSNACRAKAKEQQKRQKEKCLRVCKTNETIEELNKKALAEHLSYGQYIAKYGL